MENLFKEVIYHFPMNLKIGSNNLHIYLCVNKLLETHYELIYIAAALSTVVSYRLPLSTFCVVIYLSMILCLFSLHKLRFICSARLAGSFQYNK